MQCFLFCFFLIQPACILKMCYWLIYFGCSDFLFSVKYLKMNTIVFYNFQKHKVFIYDKNKSFVHLLAYDFITVFAFNHFTIFCLLLKSILTFLYLKLESLLLVFNTAGIENNLQKIAKFMNEFF